ncbi:unnamed protein product [Leptosia nina]|uniref:Uncharacterized protein n=1 Tax=Leptosia nina TaxID=320188 RepID=A0AAV1IY94_9NEOP
MLSEHGITAPSRSPPSQTHTPQAALGSTAITVRNRPTDASRNAVTRIIKIRTLVIKSVEFVSDNYSISGIVARYLRARGARRGGMTRRRSLQIFAVALFALLISHTAHPTSRQPGHAHQRHRSTSSVPEPYALYCVTPARLDTVSVRYDYQISKITDTLAPS